MELIRLQSANNKYFPLAWEIYLEAFPPEERKTLDAQTQLMNNPLYHYDIVIVDDELIGFVLWWNLDSVRFIDHFATASKHRNKDFGKMILENFVKNHNKPVLLEVELPYSDINKRRIKFYERIGFKLNLHHYELPVFIEGEPPLQLLLMTYPNAISEKETKQFMEVCHPIVYKQ